MIAKYKKSEFIKFIEEMTVVKLLREPGGEYMDGYKEAMEDFILD